MNAAALCTTRLTKLVSGTAICRGAVLKGLGGQLVVNHIPNYNCGVETQESFKNHHREEDKHFDSLRGVWVARRQMRWFLTRVLLISHS